MSAEYTLNESSPEALVIHCSDPRFQQTFRSFVLEELGIKNYVPLIIPGSISPVGIQDLQPKYFKTLYQQLKLLSDLFKVPRAIIINHDDCRGYERIKGYLLPRRIPLSEQQKRDLLAAAEILREFLPETSLELYQARIGEKKQIFFKKIL